MSTKGLLTLGTLTFRSMERIVIAIDGFSACGKSTTAKAVAHLMKYVYIDTGAMYRAVTLYFLEHYINLTDPKQVLRALEAIELEFEPSESGQDCEMFLNGINVSERIREMKVSDHVSQVSALPEVREKMVAQQRKLGKKKGVVMDGRDIGTVVFPQAELKIFMKADLDVRAARRQAELLERGHLVNLKEIKKNLAKRDEIDTTHITFSEQVEEIINLATAVMIRMDHQNKVTTR